VAFLAMVATHDELIEKEWPIRLLSAGLPVPADEVDWTFRGAFFQPMMSTLLALIDRHGLEQACVITERMLPERIKEEDLDPEFLRWMLENPVNSETVEALG